MDINKTYNNPNLEIRRKQLVAKAKADEALRRSKATLRTRAFDPKDEVRLAREGTICGALSERIVHRLSMRSKKSALRLKPAYRLLTVVAERSNLLSPEHFGTYIHAMFLIISRRDWWVRMPEDWRPSSYNVARQFSQLLRHIFASYRVPAFFDSAWTHSLEGEFDWFIHVGRGNNLRTAANLPIPLTKMMAHHVLEAPNDLTITQALRYGQACGLGINPRVAIQLAASLLGDGFVPENEAFWTTVLRFLARHAMIDPAQIGPLIDYLHNQKYERGAQRFVDGEIVRDAAPQPGLSMNQRDPVTLLAQMEAWHRRLARQPKVVEQRVWKPCGIAGYERTEGEGAGARRFGITEILNSVDLTAEGKAMSHCVASYAWSCASGRTAIYSMTSASRDGVERMQTVEIVVRDRRIVQSRGKYNKLPSQLDTRILRAWATKARLTFGVGAGVR